MRQKGVREPEGEGKGEKAGKVEAKITRKSLFFFFLSPTELS